jgi:integrase/recombinase XerD
MGQLQDRMRNELRIRGYSPKTIALYVGCMKQFVAYCKKSPDTLGREEIYRYQTHLVDRNVSWCAFNQSVCALRFFYNRVLAKNWLIEHIPFQKKEASCPLS